MRRIVDLRAHRVGHHLLGRVRRELWEQPLRLKDLRVEPDVLSLAGQDHGHTVVDFFQKLIGLGGDDRARAYRFPLRGVDLSNRSEVILLHGDRTRMLLDHYPGLPACRCPGAGNRSSRETYRRQVLGGEYSNRVEPRDEDVHARAVSDQEDQVVGAGLESPGGQGEGERLVLRSRGDLGVGHVLAREEELPLQVEERSWRTGGATPAQAGLGSK